METIWKFQIPIQDEITIGMPAGARILAVQTQGADTQELTMWALVNPGSRRSSDVVARSFRLFGTGYTMPEGVVLNYIGTCQMHDGRLIWHLFEEIG